MELSLCHVYTAMAIGALMYLLNRWYRMSYISDFDEKYVFITETDSGFGHKLAVDLNMLGLNVYAGCFTKEGAADLEMKTFSNLKTILLDVTDQASVEKAKAFIENDLPKGAHLWGLVNNAGINGIMNSYLSTMEDYRQVMEVNFFGSIRVTEAFEPLIIKSRGRIIQVISAMRRACIGLSPYTCSKFALEPYADELRRNLKQFGVNVCSIEPCLFTQTSLYQNSSLTQRFQELPDWKKKHFGYDFVEKEFNKKEEIHTTPIPILSNINTTIDVVTEAMTHGLGAKHPKSRYVLGTGSRLLILLAGYTPDWFVDYFVS